MPHRINTSVLQAIKSLASPLRNYHVITMARKLHEHDRHGEIAKLSQLFLLSLPEPTPYTELAQTFDKANALTWVAYSLLDDIIDQPEKIALAHTPNILASAHTLKSISLSLYCNTSSVNAVVFKIFNETDSSINKEVSLCRATVSKDSFTIPHLQKTKTLTSLLYGKSLAHITGPAVLTRLYRPNLYPLVLTHLKTYCAMRQLLDDLHDWEVDIRNGHITAVVAALLKKFDAPEESLHQFDELIPELRRIFWESTAEEMCATIIVSASKATESFHQLLGIGTASPFIAATLLPIMQSATATAKTIKDQKALLSTLRKAQA